MTRIAICTDSTADIPPDIAQEFGIGIIPLKVIFGEQAFLNGHQLTPAEFYARLRQSSVLPTTSQPSIGEFIEFFRAQAERADEIVSIHISSALSGTLDSARAARSALDLAQPIHIVDSRSASMGLGLLAVTAAHMARDGAAAGEIVARVEALIPRMNVLFVVDTLEYLHRGGRIGGAQRFLGSLLNIKPILEIKEGRIDALEKARTKQRAMARVAELVQERTPPGETVHGAVLHAAAPDDARQLKSELQQRLSCEELSLAEISPVLGVHTGPGAFGVAFYAE